MNIFGIETMQKIRLKKKILGYANIKSVGWHVIVCALTDEFMGDIKKLCNSMIWLSIIILL